jgi:hypothetical protein
MTMSVTSRRQPTWPAKVRVIALDKPECRLGDRVVADVEIEATEALAIPWSMDYGAVDPDGSADVPKDRSMMVYLKVRGAAHHALDVRGMAWGSERLESSLQMLQPGEKVRVRIGGLWRSGPGARAKDLTGTMEVEAAILPIAQEGDMLPLLV